MSGRAQPDAMIVAPTKERLAWSPKLPIDVHLPGEKLGPFRDKLSIAAEVSDEELQSPRPFTPEGRRSPTVSSLLFRELSRHNI